MDIGLDGVFFPELKSFVTFTGDTFHLPTSADGLTNREQRVRSGFPVKDPDVPLECGKRPTKEGNLKTFADGTHVTQRCSGCTDERTGSVPLVH